MGEVVVATDLLIVLLAVGFLFQQYRLKKKERELALLVNRIDEAVISVDRDWRYTFINNAAIATHSQGKEKILGRTLWEIHPELNDTEIQKSYYEAMDAGKPVEIENYYPPMRKWFSIKAYPSRAGLTIFYRDITEEKAIKNKLIKSEEKYRTLFVNSPLPSWLYDTETLQFVDVNETAVGHYGYTRDEFLSMTIKDIRPKEDIERLLGDIVEMQKSTHQSRRGKWRHTKKNGDVITVETTAYSFNYDEKAVRLIIVNDVTQNELAKQQLIENQAKLNEAQAIAHISNWDIDLVRDIHTWSDEAYRIFGLDKSAITPSIDLFLSFIHAEDRDVIRRLMRHTLSNFKESKFDFRFTTNDGDERHGYLEWRFGHDANRNPVRLYGILQDVTDRKLTDERSRLLEEQIHEQRVEEQKKISRAIIKAQDDERNHIAQELHDNINQILFGAKFHLGIAARKEIASKELLQQPLNLISTAMHEIHLLCRNLKTPLKHAQLQETIGDLINKQRANAENPPNINFGYFVPYELSEEVKLNIYRIIQELLNNIIKHAEARNVEISMTIKGKCIRLTVSDDGKGYDVKQRKVGLGISNITDRVETFNGKVRFKSTLGEGSTTYILIPYEI